MAADWGKESLNSAAEPDMTREEIRANKRLIEKELLALKRLGKISDRTIYQTADKAAKYILDVTAPISAKYGLEIGGNVYQDGKFYKYTFPVVGNESSMGNLLDINHSVYHTHPNGVLSFSTNVNTQSTNGGDVSWANRYNTTVYMGHYQGSNTYVGACARNTCNNLSSIERGRKVY